MSRLWLYLEPLDVLYLRGNSAFGGPGDHAEALMPPWPSVFSGALRSALLARAGVNLGRFTDEGAEHSKEEYKEVLGTPSTPGTFRLAAALLGRRDTNNGAVEAVFPLPADLVIAKGSGPQEEGSSETTRCAPCPAHDPKEKKEKEKHKAHGAPLEVDRLRPLRLGALLPQVRHGGPTRDLPVLVRGKEGKAESGYWLTADGWNEYRLGRTPSQNQLVKRSDLWDTDFRLGIARSRESYTVETGRIYTTQAVALKDNTGFLVAVEGCPAELLRGIDLVRLGGDGRGARVHLLTEPPPIGEAQPGGGRLALVLLTPGLFPGGWVLPGAQPQNGEYRLACEGFSARLACAAVSRAQVVSGWDLPAHRPKPAQRAVPAGSVYYLDEVQGDVQGYLQHLWDIICDELTQRGGTDTYDTVWLQRRAEGFNNFLVASWPDQHNEAK